MYYKKTDKQINQSILYNGTGTRICNQIFRNGGISGGFEKHHNPGNLFGCFRRKLFLPPQFSPGISRTLYKTAKPFLVGNRQPAFAKSVLTPATHLCYYC